MYENLGVDYEKAMDDRAEILKNFGIKMDEDPVQKERFVNPKSGLKSGLIMNEKEIWTYYGIVNRNGHSLGLPLLPGHLLNVKIGRAGEKLQAKKISTDFDDLPLERKSFYSFDGTLAFNERIYTKTHYTLNGDMFYFVPRIGFVLGNGLPRSTTFVAARLKALPHPFKLVADFVCGWEAEELNQPNSSQFNVHASVFQPSGHRCSRNFEQS